jgi:hypothetical protein
MAVLERWLWFYVRYFALVLGGGAILLMIGWPIYWLLDWWRQQRWRV